MRLPFLRGAPDGGQPYDAVIAGAGLSGLSIALSCQDRHGDTLAR